MIRAFAFVAGMLLAAPLAWSAPAGEPIPVEAVGAIVIPVSQLDRSIEFYRKLGFVTQDSGTRLRLGREEIELTQASGRMIPADSRSNDRWFQHLAIVVSDIDKAWAAALAAGGTPISAGPQLLPAWNPNAGGIRAAYFRDPDGHPLEVIQFPLGKGEPRWQAQDRLFLGIDHTAIAASDTDASLGFYRDRLGLQVAGRSENWGVEQERLSAVPGARVRITTLRATTGPGIELLHYLSPASGRPMPTDTTHADLWAEEVSVFGRAAPIAGEYLRDPDGHLIHSIVLRQEAAR